MTVTFEPPFTTPDIFLSELPKGAGKSAVDKLGRLIAQGKYPVRATIPMEADLADMLGVSRTVVRDAIKVLSGKGDGPYSAPVRDAGSPFGNLELDGPGRHQLARPGQSRSDKDLP